MPDRDVSVVIATHQRRDACREAVASALGQTRPPLEVIVAVDGSDDGTAEMLAEWGARDPRVRSVVLDPPAGRPAPPRNHAIAQARGRWVAFLDDDDTWREDKLEFQAALFDDADVIGANALVDGAPYFADAPAQRAVPAAELLRTNPLILSSTVVRRDLLLAVGGFPEAPGLRGIEDYALWFALADAGARIVVSGAPLVRYARHDEPRLSASTVRNEVAVARLFWRRWRAHPADRRLRRAALGRASYALTIARDRVLAR